MDFPGTETITGTLICVCVCGGGEQARVMATIGVTRGLGDHDLKVYNSNIYIKPFLSCLPEVGGTNLKFPFPASHHTHMLDSRGSKTAS